MDGTANPHLAIAAVATAGLLGLRHSSRLPPPFRGNPAALPEKARKQPFYSNAHP
jgi:glutamine synthetase